VKKIQLIKLGKNCTTQQLLQNIKLINETGNEKACLGNQGGSIFIFFGNQCASQINKQNSPFVFPVWLIILMIAIGVVIIVFVILFFSVPRLRKLFTPYYDSNSTKRKQSQLKKELD